MFHTCIIQAGRAYEPTEIAALRAALKLACDRWDLDEPLTDARRNHLAATILTAAQAGFSNCDTLARIALDNCKISDATGRGQSSLPDLYRRLAELTA